MADARFIGEEALASVYQNVQGDMVNFPSSTTPSFKKVGDEVTEVDNKVSAIKKATETEFENWLTSIEDD